MVYSTDHSAWYGVWVRSSRRHASLGGLEALVFTGGVGGHASVIRSRACAELRFLGTELDEAANAGATGDVEITADGAAVRVVVLRAREDFEMARQAEVALRG
jgi:acetate kinase